MTRVRVERLLTPEAEQLLRGKTRTTAQLLDGADSFHSRLIMAFELQGEALGTTVNK